MNKELLIAALRGNNVAEFSTATVNSKAISDILSEVGLSETPSGRDLIAKKDVLFAIVSEQIDEILPKDVADIMGAYAEVKSFARDNEVIFEVKTGQRRARLSIRKGARSGVYRAAQWDKKVMSLDTEVQTVGVYVTLEDLILGRTSLAELYNNILKGFEEIIYEETVAALRTAKTLAPASHISTVGESTTLNAELDKALRIASAYGNNVAIIGFKSLLSEVQNITDFKNADDRADIRAHGYVREYKGYPIIELPNYILKDGSEIEWAFKENDLFILPGDAKPVKVAFRGDAVTDEVKEATGGMMWNTSKMMGVGLLLADNVCIVTKGTDSSGRY